MKCGMSVCWSTRRAAVAGLRCMRRDGAHIPLASIGQELTSGRGVMRYRDPESRPTNYNPRGHDTRARYRRGRADEGRWEHDGGAGERHERSEGGERGERGGRGGRAWENRERGGRGGRGEEGGRSGGRQWDADRWDRAAPTFERATDKWDMGRMGDGAASARSSLAARLGGRDGDVAAEGEAEGRGEELDYSGDREAEVERELQRDGVEGRSARAAAWAAARRDSPRRESPGPRRSMSPVRGEDRRSVSPRLSRGRSMSSDMVMDE